jgi:hypothetical protein
MTQHELTECGAFVIETEKAITGSDSEMETRVVEKKIGWIYAEESEQKPIIAQKADSGEKIKYAEMSRIMDEQATKEHEGLLKPKRWTAEHRAVRHWWLSQNKNEVLLGDRNIEKDVEICHY